ncbi:MAG: hypothetical protein L3J22_00955 [Xanthomonadales bacterium]|nr:hypothetical protein [Xanthomonadales bacterium]
MMLNKNTKFVLVGLGRCGSNLLKFGLRQNSRIVMAGEYFNKHSHPESLQQDGKARAQAFFEDSRRNRVRAVGFKIFLHHGRLHITYENLIQDWDQLTTDIQNFVGAKATSVEKSLRKQEYMPLSQRCPNLAELQTFFQNSPYRWMFE